MRAATRFVPLLLLIASCATGGDEDSAVRQALGGTASINLSNASARVTLTSDSQWSLTKTGSVSGNTVTWNITATKTATVSGQLVVQGQMTVTNAGSGPATIGNIVVNLQTRVGSQWKSASADVADATHGDAATTAKIHAQASSEGLSSFTENSASGSLEFMDATNNTVFSLVPEISIPGGATKSLLFQATFDNNVLHLASGAQVRAETIISFGNATANGNSTANVDINGNGTIDNDEHRIRSVPSRLTLAVPPTTNGASNPTLSDAASDISATGTVSFSNVMINLGATSGTVTATVNGGTDGGNITNCAHLTDPGIQVTSGGFTFWQVDPLDLQSCNTQAIGGSGGGTCTAGTPGCGWTAGNLTTYTQDSWGDATAAGGAKITSTFGTVFPGGVEIGIAGAAGYSAAFQSAEAIIRFLPQTDSPGTLDADLVDPTSTHAGIFAADVLALTLNVAESDANLLNATSSTHLGDLYVCGTPVTAVNGQTVRQVLATANTLLGGGSSSLTVSGALFVATNVNNAFVDGSPSSFAQSSLFVGGCP